MLAEKRQLSIQFGRLAKGKKNDDSQNEVIIEAVRSQIVQVTAEIDLLHAEVETKRQQMDETLKSIGNLVHEDVVVSCNQKDHLILREWGKEGEVEQDMRYNSGGRSNNVKRTCEAILSLVDGWDIIRGECSFLSFRNTRKVRNKPHYLLLFHSCMSSLSHPSHLFYSFLLKATRSQDKRGTFLKVS